MKDETNNKENPETTETTQTTDTTAAQGVFDASSLAAPEVSSTAGGAESSRVAELERQLQQERVEKGRLKATNEELRRAQEEIARLKSENAKLVSRRAGDYLSDEDRGKIDAEQLDVIDKVVKGRVEDLSAQMQAERQRIAAEREQNAKREEAMRKAQFDAEVERLAPGLARAVAEGSRDEWTKWTGERRRASSVADAFRNFDAATVADFLMEFAQLKGIQPQGDGLAARPSASYSPRGGNHPAYGKGDQTVYTLEQVNAALRAAAADCEAGKITLEERRAIQKKYDAAYAEGRVVER